MKKIAIILSLVGMIGSSFGQGVVNLSNTSGSQNVSTNNTHDIFGNSLATSASGLTAGSTAAPQGFYYALLMQTYSGSGPTVSSTASSLLSDGWTFTGAYATNALGAGRFGGGIAAATTAGDVVGVANQFILVGWSSSLGNTWAQVSALLASGFSENTIAGFFGVSGTGTGVGQSSTSPEILFGGASGIQSPFTLFAVPVPEPTTMALAGLGGLSLLLFRRRKA